MSVVFTCLKIIPRESMCIDYSSFLVTETAEVKISVAPSFPYFDKDFKKNSGSQQRLKFKSCRLSDTFQLLAPFTYDYSFMRLLLTIDHRTFI